MLRDRPLGANPEGGERGVPEFYVLVLAIVSVVVCLEITVTQALTTHVSTAVEPSLYTKAPTLNSPTTYIVLNEKYTRRSRFNCHSFPPHSILRRVHFSAKIHADASTTCNLLDSELLPYLVSHRKIYFNLCQVSPA